MDPHSMSWIYAIHREMVGSEDSVNQNSPLLLETVRLNLQSWNKVLIIAE